MTSIIIDCNKKQKNKNKIFVRSEYARPSQPQGEGVPLFIRFPQEKRLYYKYNVTSWKSWDLRAFRRLV